MVYQGLLRIDRAIADGSFFDNQALSRVVDGVRQNGCDLHLMPLVSDSGIHTGHTIHPVPLVLLDDSRRQVRLRQGRLADIAPTVLDIMGLEQPKEMTGTVLMENQRKNRYGRSAETL